jgi:excisionase family DNA binding protein
MTDRMMTPGQVADYLSIDEGTVRLWCRTRQIKAAKIGHQWRIAPADVRAKLDEGYAVQDGPDLYADVLEGLTAGIAKKSPKIAPKNRRQQAKEAA